MGTQNTIKKEQYCQKQWIIFFCSIWQDKETSRKTLGHSVLLRSIHRYCSQDTELIFSTVFVLFAFGFEFLFNLYILCVMDHFVLKF